MCLFLNRNFLFYSSFLVYFLFCANNGFAQKLDFEKTKKTIDAGIKTSKNPPLYLIEFARKHLHSKDYSTHDDWNNSLKYLEKKSFEFGDQENYLKLLNIVATSMQLSGKYTEAYYFIYKANEDSLSWKKIDPVISKKLLIQTAFSNYYFKQFDKCAYYLKRALTYNNLTTHDSIKIYNTLGLVYRDTGKEDTAISYFKITLDIAKRIQDEAWIAISSGNIGYFDYLHNDFINARKYITTDYTFSKKSKEYGSEINALSLLMKIDTKEGKLDSAKFKLLLLDSLLKRNYSIGSAFHFYEAKTLYYATIKNYDSLYTIYRKFTRYQDSLMNNRNKENMKRTEFQVRFENQQYEVKLLEEKKRSNEIIIISLIIIGVVIVTTLSLVLYQVSKRRKQEKAIASREKEIMDQELVRTEKEIRKTINSLIEKNEMIEILNDELIILQQHNIENERIEKNKITDKLQSFTLLTDDDWLEFKKAFEILNPGFYGYLLKKQSDLTNAELRLISLIKLNLSNLEMSRVLGISPDSVRKTSLRLRKKLNMQDQDELLKFILDL